MTYTNEEYQIYLKVKHALLLEDARNYARDYLENSDEKCLDLDDITEEQFETIDFEQMVSDFEQHTDYFDPTADVWHGIVENYFEDYFWIDNGDYWKCNEVLAWMPLPEPAIIGDVK